MISDRLRMLLVIGPTAVGKSTLLGRAIGEFPRLKDVITYTTRDPRPGEEEGIHYHFLSADEFKRREKEGFFYETANVHGKHYGTPRDQVENARKAGDSVIMDVDVQGAKKLKAIFPEAVTVFILPPSEEALRQRFRKRGVVDEGDLNRRLESAKLELAQAKDFDYQLVNDDFERTYAEFRKIVDQLINSQ